MLSVGYITRCYRPDGYHRRDVCGCMGGRSTSSDWNRVGVVLNMRSLISVCFIMLYDVYLLLILDR
jgi:hypothetical protein